MASCCIFLHRIGACVARAVTAVGTIAVAAGIAVVVGKFVDSLLVVGLAVGMMLVVLVVGLAVVQFVVAAYKSVVVHIGLVVVKVGS